MKSSSHFNCVLVGGQSFLTACGEELLKHGHTIEAVVTADSDVVAWCANHKLAALDPRSAYGEALAGMQFDYLFSIVNFSILPASVIALPKKAAINFHDGPLPHYAGLNATTWALLNQEAHHAVTWHVMTEAADKGDILMQRELLITDSDTALTLNARCYEVALACFADLVTQLESGEVVKTSQDLSRFRFFSRCKRPSPACLLEWRRSATALETQCRALSFGNHANPIGLPKILLGGKAYMVEQIEIVDGPGAMPGAVTHVDEGGVHVGTAAGQIRMLELMTPGGERVSAADALRRHGLQAGDFLPLLSEEAAATLAEVDQRACRNEPFWLDGLKTFEPLDLPLRSSALRSGRVATLAQTIDAAISPAVEGTDAGERLLTAWLLYLSRIGGKARVGISLADSGLRDALAGHESLFAARQPLSIEIDGALPFGACHQQVQEAIRAATAHFTYARDLPLRVPELRTRIASLAAALTEVGAERVGSLADHAPDTGLALNLVIADDGREVLWVYDPACYDETQVRRMQGQFETLLAALNSSPDSPVAELSMISDAERRTLAQWNATTLGYAAECIHHAFEAQARRTPEAQALLFRDQALSFGELDARADQLAARLRQRGVGPDQIVGLLLTRSDRMVVAMLGILKAGGAYLPLDPTYPEDRIRYMIEDAAIRVVVTEERFEELLAQSTAERVHLESEHGDAPAAPTDTGATPDNLAYVIYTSGSTGKPKGVMINHRNVANFFAGMDQRLGRPENGVWLAVTSISFDISVLEILWSLTRGLGVVIYSGDDRSAGPVTAGKPLDLSLYYFPSDDGTETREKFRLLLEGARFADANGFAAVWTPERHFHAFGGLFPNPSVSSAALATITRKVKIRAGSCVLPLHHPVRVAEEWAFVDNVSDGRVGIAFAAGWQPNDFVFAPQNYHDRQQVMYRNIQTVRALWRGETVEMAGVDGKPVAIAIKPRPVQKELPFWVTAAGNPETYRHAGEIGANLLTHLLGQSLEEVGEKVRIYREAWRAHGHAGEGCVTLMLHTLVGPDEQDVRRKAHDALKTYLATAAGLLKHYASSFPTFKTHAASGRNVDEIFASLPPADVDALLEHAVARYYETSGLFGSLERCEAMVERCMTIGVDEIACLIDFGMAPEVALEHLPYLGELRARLAPVGAVREDFSIPALLERHRVTHFQCTPSMATMLVADRRGREALRNLKHMLVGGEDFPPSLAAELHSLMDGELLNMYGPTETTVWSSSFRVEKTEGPISIGTPIANTTLYVLDQARQPVPVGLPGELYIGGDGVVRGYLNRPELTAERFLPDPFSPDANARMYRTGDRVRFGEDGRLEFLGRIDNQVKIRGYRIELGEIESALRAHPAVREAAVSLRDEHDAKRLAAYLVPRDGHALDPAEIRTFLRRTIAEFMLPSSFTVLAALPLTPNGKLDRGALPAPSEAATATAEFAAPSTLAEQRIAESWQDLLKRGPIGVNDDFFHIGGDSLGAVQLVAMLSDAFGVELPLETIFVAPTIARLAGKIETLINANQAGAA